MTGKRKFAHIDKYGNSEVMYADNMQYKLMKEPKIYLAIQFDEGFHYRLYNEICGNELVKAKCKTKDFSPTKDGLQEAIKEFHKQYKQVEKKHKLSCTRDISHLEFERYEILESRKIPKEQKEKLNKEEKLLKKEKERLKALIQKLNLSEEELLNLR